MTEEAAGVRRAFRVDINRYTALTEGRYEKRVLSL